MKNIMKNVLKKCTIHIELKNSEIIQAILERSKTRYGYDLTFYSEFQYKRIHHINKLEINDPANFVASYISRKYSNDRDHQFTSVTALDKNLQVIGKVDVNIIKEPILKNKITENITIMGKTYDKNKISDLLLKYESDVLPELLQYTKCGEINVLLNLCKQPLDYDRKLSKMFTDTHTRILRLKKDGVDVYVNVKSYMIYIVSNRKEVYFIDNINKSKYISNIITNKISSKIKNGFNPEKYYKI